MDRYTQNEINEATKYTVLIRWSDEDGVFIASALGLDGTSVHGSSQQEALNKVNEAVCNWLYGVRSVGGEIPLPESQV